MSIVMANGYLATADQTNLSGSLGKRNGTSGKKWPGNHLLTSHKPICENEIKKWVLPKSAFALGLTKPVFLSLF